MKSKRIKEREGGEEGWKIGYIVLFWAALVLEVDEKELEVALRVSVHVSQQIRSEHFERLSKLLCGLFAGRVEALVVGDLEQAAVLFHVDELRFFAACFVVASISKTNFFIF